MEKREAEGIKIKWQSRASQRRKAKLKRKAKGRDMRRNQNHLSRH